MSSVVDTVVVEFTRDITLYSACLGHDLSTGKLVCADVFRAERGQWAKVHSGMLDLLVPGCAKDPFAPPGEPAAEVPERSADPVPRTAYRQPSQVGKMHIHGGPESQARPAYSALFQCLLANGIAVMAPNVRGSTGYGFAWQKRIYLDWGGVDLADFEAGAEYLKTLDWIDPDRMAVMGQSYGGFAALSCLTRLPDLWAAGISLYGPANLETLARSMPPGWATTVATMFGDPDKDAQRMQERSPVTYAHQISAPLLVIQGANDRRVPKAEADQIVAAARANHAEVDYLVFSDEGHGFTTRNNGIKAQTTVVDFLTKHLQ